MLKKTSQKGFTIVELLIVIVVIGILAALVLNTYNNVQASARNTERQTDIKSIQTQLESVFAEEGGYPIQSQMATADAADAALPGIGDGAFNAPGGDEAFDLDALAADATVPTETGTSDYVYVPQTCGTDPYSCEGFALVYTTEGDDGETIKVEDNNN